VPELRDLELLLRSAVPILVIETREERRVLELFTRLTLLVPRPLFHWTVTEGLRRADMDMGTQAHAREPEELLGQIKSTRTPGIYVLSDFHPFMDTPLIVRYLKDIALAWPELKHTVVLVSHELPIPDEIAWLCRGFEMRIPDRRQLEQIVLGEARAWSSRHPGRNVRTSRENMGRLVDNLAGLPVSDAQRLARGAIEDDGAITESDLPRVNRAKFDLLSSDGVLSFEFDTARFGDVGGLAGLKRWLELREAVFRGSVDGLDRPKGVLLLGVQGCGKSLAAKAVAGSWGTPLLRLDFGTLYNKFHGETERNLRESLRQAEAMAPCVLWIDEIEKGVGTDGADGGTSKRVLGTLLTWMAENRAPVFVVATANDIQSLPPELLRKGRLDEIFFVDLPDTATRADILRIHARRRGIDPQTIDPDAAAVDAEGFSGAELEQALVSTLYAARAGSQEPSAPMLLDEIRSTRPLSVVMAERVAELRRWAASRTVPAN
jgi:MoxR-like ATPase